jgi:hypothetical protein
VFGLLCDWGTFARVFVDESGIAIYSVTSASRGILQVQATAARLASFPARPAQNTLVARSADGRFAIFILNTGEYQVNGGPDFEGKVRVCIFRTLAPTVHEKYEFFGGPPGSSNPFVDASGALPTGGTNGGGGGTCTVDTSSGRTYTVRRGDNLFRIALNNGTTVAQLARINCIANQTLVFVGQVLSLP